MPAASASKPEPNSPKPTKKWSKKNSPSPISAEQSPGTRQPPIHAASRTRIASREQTKSKTAPFEKRNPKGSATQFKSMAHALVVAALRI
jgi:hypothetical protein